MSEDDAVRPQLYLNYDPFHDFLIALEFGRIDEGQPEGSWEGHSEQLGFLHDGPDGRYLGFKLQEGIGDYDPDAEDNEVLWREGPRFDVPLLGLRDVTANEVIVGARAHFGGRQSHNRDLFKAALSEEDGRQALELWQRCLEAGDSMAHYALGYTAFELGRPAQAYRHLRHYAEISPLNPWAQAWYGRAAMALGEHNEAHDARERAIELEEVHGEETDAAEWLDRLLAPGAFEAVMSEFADGLAWKEWDGGARLGADPVVLVDVPGGPLLAELDLDGGEDGVGFLQVEIGAGSADALPRAGDGQARWLVTKDGRVWLASMIGDATVLEVGLVRIAAAELVRRAIALRAAAADAGFDPPMDFATFAATSAATPSPRREDHGGNIVYGAPLGDLVFAREAEAHTLADLHRALAAATTWGALEATVLAEHYEHCVHYRMPGDDEDVDPDADSPPEPAPDAPFDTSQISTIGDSEFPPNPIDSQPDWMPEDVLALGHLEQAGMIGPDWMRFDVEDEAAIVAGLERHGYVVRRDDALIGAAVGA